MLLSILQQNLYISHKTKGMIKHLFLFVVVLFTVQAKTTIIKVCIKKNSLD